jgi:hypothetical protein
MTAARRKGIFSVRIVVENELAEGETVPESQRGHGDITPHMFHSEFAGDCNAGEALLRAADAAAISAAQSGATHTVWQLFVQLSAPRVLALD